jgi:hypothetical protein
MTRAIVWKEFREQGLIGLTLVVLGGGVLVAVAMFADPPQSATAADVFRAFGPGPLATLLLAVTAGTVCGGALFAAEREAGTHGFLDALPARRSQVWFGKVVAGAALVAVQAGAVIAAGLGLGLLSSPGWAVAVAVYAFLAFCWGVLGSTLARTTLGSVGVAVPAAAGAAILFLLPILLFFSVPNSPAPRPVGAVLFLGLMTATPLLWSAAAYTRPDWVRESDDRVPPRPAVYLAGPDRAAPAPAAAPRPRFGAKALAWLSVRQLARPGLALSAFAVVTGLVLLLPTVEPFLAWPAIGVLAGVLAGVTAFADEQVNGTGRFWGERRLPVGRMWAGKLAAHAALALWLAGLVAIPLVARALTPGGSGVRGESFLSAVFKTLMFEPRALGPEGWKYLFAPIGYGFAAGVVGGMLFKKPVVGAGVAGVVGGTGFALWLPSLVAGGTWHLWLWLPPVLGLLAGRGVLRAWASDRVGTPRGLGPLVGGAGAVLLAAAAGVGFRAVQVPDTGGGADDYAYVVALPPFEKNEAGRGFRAAAEQFARVSLLAPPAGTGRRRAAERVEQFRASGFAADDKELVDWVAAVYELDRPPTPPGAAPPPPPPREQTWHGFAALTAEQAGAVGLFEHPLVTKTAAGSPTLENGRVMAGVILARGVYRQAAGDPAAFPDDLATALAVSRSMRNGSVVSALARGDDVTRLALSATRSWLARLDGHPDLLRRVLDEWLRDERAVMTRIRPDGTVAAAELPAAGWGAPFDPLPYVLAERHVLREQMKAPTEWLPDLLTPAGKDREAANPAVDLVAFGWSVPWERERTRRLVAYGLDPDHADDYRRLTRGRPGAGLMNLRNLAPGDLAGQDQFTRTCRRALIVQLAARIYHHTNQAFPADPTALVAAGLLPELPPDPYSAAAPLRYRLPAADEVLPASPPQPTPGTGAGRQPPPVTVRAGQPVVWSVGLNGTDEGGLNLPVALSVPPRGADLVFVTPLPGTDPRP